MDTKNYWRTKSKSELDALRGSMRWQRLREAVLQHHPLCVVCKALGRNFPATEVHHIVPAVQMIRRYGREGFFREDNLVALCARCHDRNERAYIRGVEDVVFPESERGCGKFGGNGGEK